MQKNLNENAKMTDTSFFINESLARQVSSFPGDKISDFPDYIRALLRIREASADANAALGYLPREKAGQIEDACSRILSESSEFSQLDQTVIRFAGKPAQRIIDKQIVDAAAASVSVKDVTLNQTTGDVESTAEAIAVRTALLGLADNILELSAVIGSKAEEFKDVVKCGRLGLRDSLPMRLGDEFQAYQTMLMVRAEALIEEAQGWNVCLLGSGDVANGLGVLPGFAEEVKTILGQKLGYELKSVDALAYLMSNQSQFIVAHAKIQAAADVIWKIARDLTILSSGPRAGIREMVLPAVAPGSSIMPGKINPTVAELIMHLCDKVFSNAAGLNSGVHSGWLGSDMHSALPLKSILDSCSLLSGGCQVFTQKVISGVTANVERSLEHAKLSLAIQPLLALIVGEEDAKKTACYAFENGLTLQDAYARLHGEIAKDSLVAELFDLKAISDKEGAAAFMKRVAAVRFN